MKELETLGCLWTGEQDTDYVLCDGDIDLLPNLYQQDNIRYEYNQSNQSWSKKSCTIFMAIGMVSDLMNYEFSLKEIKEIDELSYEKGRTRWEWWYVKSAVDLVYKWWNTNDKLVKKYWKIAYYTIRKDSTMIDEVLKKWYTIWWNFCPTIAYSKDYNTDAVLDWCEFGNKTSWHAIDIIWDENFNNRAVKDSYKGRRTYDNSKESNRYELKHPIVELTNYWSFYYVYTKVQEDNMEEIKRLNEIKAKCNVIIDHLSGLWHMVNDENFRGILHYTAEKLRKKINDANEQLKKYI